jgi:exosortase
VTPPSTTVSGTTAAGASSVRDRSSIAAWPRVAVYLLIGELVLLYAPTVRFLWARWTMSVWHNAHGALVPPIVAFLIYQELKRFRGAPPSSNVWGFGLLLPALALQALDAGMHTQLLSAVSIVIALPGLSLLLLGTERTRAILFPLLFLAAALPIPLGMTEQIHMQLRLIATAASGWAVSTLGIPVFVEGTTLHLAPGPLLISDACSGFSTLYAAVAVACLTAHSAGTTARKVRVLLFAAPLAIAANVLRIVLLTVLVVWKGSWILGTFIHPLSGMMTFAIALPIIFWLGGDAHRVSPRDANV